MSTYSYMWVMHKNDEDKLLVKAVSQSYWVLSHSLRNIGCALMCPFISLSTVVTADAFLYQLTASALSHRKHGCLTAVFMSLCVSLCYVHAYYMLQSSPSYYWNRQDCSLRYDFSALLVSSLELLIHKSREKNWHCATKDC